MEMFATFRKRHPEVVSHVAPTDEGLSGHKGRRLLSILNKKKLERVLGYSLDENEFLGPHGIRSLSRHHLEHPFTFWVGPQLYKVQYLPAESSTGMFGGNSNWRGPVWMPVNALIQNIGYDLGENNRTAEWYGANHRTPWVAERLADDKFSPAVPIAV